MTIARHYLRLQRVSLFVWLGVVVMLAAATASSASAVTEGNTFQEILSTLPIAFQRLVGEGISNPVDAFLAVKLMFIMPVLLGVSGAIAAAAAVTRERDLGTADFLLSLPVKRERVILERFGAIALGLTGLYAAIWLTLLVVLKSIGLQGSLGAYAAALGGGLAVNIAQAALVLAFSIRSGEYSRVVRYALGFVLVTYGIDVTLKTANTLPWLRYFMLFKFSDSVELITSPGRVWLSLFACAVLSVVAVRWAQQSFKSRQLEA